MRRTRRKRCARLPWGARQYNGYGYQVMLSHVYAGARAVGLAMLAASVFTACGGSEDAAPADAAPAQPGASAPARLVVDTGSAAPVAGGTLTLKAVVLGADGQELKGARFTWASSDESVAIVTAASDKEPAASASAPVGAYATVRTLAAGTADISATATLPDGSAVTSVTRLDVSESPAKSYTLTLAPALLNVAAGGPAQTVIATVRRSDGVDGVADLTQWSWNSDEASFVVTMAAGGNGADVASPASATTSGSGTLTACATAPSGARLCANAALARSAAPPPTYTVGGAVSGLATGKSLVLSDSNGDALAVSSNGAFTLPSARGDATAYAISVSGHPAGQTCTVTHGAGTIAAANVTNVAVGCVQAQFVVLPQGTPAAVSVYRVNPASGALAPVPGSPFAAAGAIRDIAFSPSGATGYALTASAVVPYSLDPATGALTALPAYAFPIVDPYSIVANPLGNTLHVGGYRSLHIVRLNADGMPDRIVQSVVDPFGTDPMTGIAVSADGLRSYAVGWMSGRILQVQFDPATGILGFADPVSTAAAMPSRIALAPDGTRLYTASTMTNAVGIHTLNPVSGTITGNQTFTTGSMPSDIALASSGKFAYTYNQGSADIRVYQLDAITGLPTSSRSTRVGYRGERLAIDGTGKYLYAPGLVGGIHGYAVSQTTGELTELPGSPYASGTGAVAFAIVQPRP